MSTAQSESLPIALLTDFGTQDEYIGVMKGVISSINPGVRTIDLSHEVPPQDVMGASFILYKSYRFFPKGTIFLVVVDPGVGTRRRMIILEAGGYYFVAPDNGVLTFILGKEKPKRVIEVTNEGYFLKPISRTFHGRDCFAPVAAHLSKGVEPAKFGKKVTDPVMLRIPAPFISPKKTLVGQVIQIDRFGNLVTNIDYGTFERFRKGHPVEGFKIKLGRKVIPRLLSSYAEARPGELLAIFGSSNHLEISLNLGSARRLLRAKVGSKVEVELRFA